MQFTIEKTEGLVPAQLQIRIDVPHGEWRSHRVFSSVNLPSPWIPHVAKHSLVRLSEPLLLNSNTFGH